MLGSNKLKNFHSSFIVVHGVNTFAINQAGTFAFLVFLKAVGSAASHTLKKSAFLQSVSHWTLQLFPDILSCRVH